MTILAKDDEELESIADDADTSDLEIDYDDLGCYWEDDDSDIDEGNVVLEFDEYELEE